MITLPRLILFSLAVFGDVVRVLPKNKKQAWNFWFGSYSPLESAFNRHSFTGAVENLLSTESIQKVVVGNKVKVRITPKGLRLLSMNLDLEKFSRKKWDGKWRTVIFDIEEKSRHERDSLREELKGLGFGKLQESVWISPFPIENEINDYLHQRKILGEILVCRAELLVGDPKRIASRVWRLEELSDEYAQLRDFWFYLKPAEKNKRNAFEFQRRYFEILWKDPFLPKEFLPAYWAGEATKKIYLKQVLPTLTG